MRSGFGLVTSIALVLFTSTAAAERPAERRVATFIDGAVPRIQVGGDRFVHGEFELEIRFVNTNPLCFSYAVDGKRVTESKAPAAQPAWNEMVTSAAGAQQFKDIDEAQAAIDTRIQDLGTLSMEASNEASMDQVWGACLWANPPSRVMPLQHKRIAEVDGMLRTRLGANGAWTRILVGALDTLASVRKQLDTLPVREEASPEDTASARRRLHASALGLERYVTATLALVHRIQEDLQRAQTRLASAPAAAIRHVAANRKVVIEVQRSRLDRGSPEAALDTVTVTSEAYESLHPILFDVGIGPSVTFHNTEDYGLGQKASGQPPNVKRTEDGANVDVVVSMSMYIWGYRYLDDGIFDAKQLLPRPMIGLSMDQPFSSIYLGAQLDPIQFLDISVGARAYSTNHLIAPEEGQLAYTDTDGDPTEPVLRRGVTTQLFVSLTASTDLFQRWIQRSF